MTTVITRVADGDNVIGRDRSVFKDYTLSGTYAALTINASDVGLKFFKGVIVAGGDASLETYFPVIEYSAGGTVGAPAGTSPQQVILKFVTATATAASGTLSPTINIRLLFIGQ